MHQLSLFGQVIEAQESYQGYNPDFYTEDKTDKVAEEIIYDIESKDVNNMTPMEALKFLSEIKAKLEEKK